MGTIRARVHPGLAQGCRVRVQSEEESGEALARGPGWTGALHLILLLEAVALSCLHLVDVLQEVGHTHRRMQLPRVVWGALPATRTLRRAPQEAAGLSDPTAALIPCSQRKRKGFLTYIGFQPEKPQMDLGAERVWPMYRLAGLFAGAKHQLAPTCVILGKSLPFFYMSTFPCTMSRSDHMASDGPSDPALLPVILWSPHSSSLIPRAHICDFTARPAGGSTQQSL